MTKYSSFYLRLKSLKFSEVKPYYKNVYFRLAKEFVINF